MTRGIGCGQTSRIRSTKIALEQAEGFARGAILVSDAFFPFNDSVKLATKNEIAAIIQPGGSINDKLSIEAADKAGIAMVLTGERKFWH
jgi:phosphoribosylaminoimidazolecarboxamide formyltransferase/IMP cyclohydrolase